MWLLTLFSLCQGTMAWGLEARVPFLDKDFIEVAMVSGRDGEQCGCIGANG